MESPPAAPSGTDRTFFCANFEGFNQRQAMSLLTTVPTTLQRTGDCTWVIWSGRQGENHDLYARYQETGKWSADIRVTTDSGTDINPVAATDSVGHVWIAWQGLRDGNLRMLAAVQPGDGFGLIAFPRALRLFGGDCGGQPDVDRVAIVMGSARS